MTVSSRALVDLILLGPMYDRRQLQDSPVLGDVWIEFAAKPAAPLDLLITPLQGEPAGPVAVRIADRLKKLDLSRGKDQEAHVAYLQGLVAARLFFREVFLIITPMTKWWRDRKVQERLQAYKKKEEEEILRKKIQPIIKWAKAEDEDARMELAEKVAGFTALDRYAVLSGIILWAGGPNMIAPASGGGIIGHLKEIKEPDAIIHEIRGHIDKIPADLSQEKDAKIWQISLNRKALPALEKSVPAVKADAVRTLFKVKCDEIRWAVLDSGIDDKHPAFRDDQRKSRIIRAFDFSNIRKIVSLDNLDTNTPEFEKRVEELQQGLKKRIGKKRVPDILKKLAKDADNDRPIHWGLVEELIEIKPGTAPRAGHGTHVAGIIGARKEGRPKAGEAGLEGMCPDIKLYDFRVLGKTIEDTEFAIIAALQYIRYLNERNSYISIHGANLSLSIPHDVRNFACGRTPICNECERLVESGVVVVAAAGNLGYQRFETRDGLYEGYTAFSITDPGNADGVITVGATHRFWPHTYGVSFFSSRGPTGDGRLKPDIVAPGERIQSCLPGGEWGELDGTSMAAPHVSGAAAMLMARYSELIGQPRRIKLILCESATDLCRERSFQGHGMLDVLRSFQKI